MDTRDPIRPYLPFLHRFAAYGEDHAFFVSTGVNALYILYGGLILYPRMLLTQKITPEMTRLPKVGRQINSVFGWDWSNGWLKV